MAGKLLCKRGGKRLELTGTLCSILRCDTTSSSRVISILLSYDTDDDIGLCIKSYLFLTLFVMSVDVDVEIGNTGLDEDSLVDTIFEIINEVKLGLGFSALGRAMH